MRIFTLVGVFLCWCGGLANAQMPNIGPEAEPAPPQPGAIALLDSKGPDREVWHRDSGLLAVRNVNIPTLLPFLPKGKANGAAVIVAPGGGFLGLAIEKEGWRIAEELAKRGFTAFVLKYRTLPTPPDQAQFAAELKAMIHGGKASFAPPPDTPTEAQQDGLAALKYVRTHAAEWGIDAQRVGFMGFSAGGFLTRSVIAEGGAQRPDFAAPIYPNMAAMNVPADAPPMFVVIAADDFLLTREQGFPLVESYRKAGRSIEFHLLSSGGHGFGGGVPGTPTEGWMDLYFRWLRDTGMTQPTMH